jgi:ATP-dependent Clp protease ATP-binding subunit ClpC
MDLLCAASEIAFARQHQVVPEDVLLALTEIHPNVGRTVLENLGVNAKQDQSQIATLFPARFPLTEDEALSFSQEMYQLFAEARAESKELGHSYVGTEHLVLAMLRCESSQACDYLRRRGVTLEKVRHEVLRLFAL